jgi:aminopeptidase YwaD
VSGRTYPFTLRFIAFGSEELGLFGSRAYVDSLSEKERASLVAMLNFDVPGSGQMVEVIGDPYLVDEVLRLGDGDALDVRRGQPLQGASSDHASFQAAGVPVAFFLADDVSRINSPADFIEFVEPELMGTVVLLAMGLLDFLAEQQVAE